MLNIIFTVLRDLFRSHRDLLLENLALRQQILVLERCGASTWSRDGDDPIGTGRLSCGIIFNERNACRMRIPEFRSGFRRQYRLFGRTLIRSTFYEDHSDPMGRANRFAPNLRPFSPSYRTIPVLKRGPVAS
jgi:hypothetical protein